MFFKKPYTQTWASLVAQTVKCLPTIWETWVQSLGQEDLLEKEMATHSSILAWKIPWMEEPGRLQIMGLQRVRHNWATSVLYTNLHIHMCGHRSIRTICVRKQTFQSECVILSSGLLLCSQAQGSAGLEVQPHTRIAPWSSAQAPYTAPLELSPQNLTLCSNTQKMVLCTL